jgi:LysM repeat protein
MGHNWLRFSSAGENQGGQMSQRVLRTVGVLATLGVIAAVLTAAAGGRGNYVVKPGDTLSAIAARYGTSVHTLVRINHLPAHGDLIYAGSTLRLPGSHSNESAHSSGRVARTYVVQPGDTLSGISGRFHEQMGRIARRNHLPSSLVVVIGQRLVISHRATHQQAAQHTAGPRLASGPAPSQTAMAAIIRSTAARWGISPQLALGVSYEEAGFNQRMISPVGAIGAMQVMPATGRWLSAEVVHRTLDLHNAQDNATAGVAMLDILLRETGGNTRLAVAGYYQGLASVRDRGMYADTKQYVANVLALRNRF